MEQSPLPGGINQNAAVGNPFGSNTFAGQISGSGSLALTGGSNLYLTNTNNTYTGYTNILSGSLPITDMGELGNSTLPIVVMGSANNAFPLPNGQLILQGGSAGLTINRNLDVGGYGTGQIGGNDNFSLVTIGNNTYNGIITAGANMDSHIYEASGIATFSASSVLNTGVAANGFINAGAGNLYVNGLATGGAIGQLSLYRWSGSGNFIGELQLNNANNNFIGDIQITGGFLRVQSPGALGLADDATSLRLDGGELELRVDPGNTNFGFIKTLDTVGNTTIFAGRGVGGVGLNQTVTFGGAVVNDVLISGFNSSTSNITTTFSGNDGYGVTLNVGSEREHRDHRRPPRTWSSRRVTPST